MNQGKLVIVAMLVVALGMSGYAWWARYSRSQRILEAWGTDAVVAIRRGDDVKLLKLAPISGTSEEAEQADDSSVEKLVGPDGELQIIEEVDLQEARGLIHARHHLIHEKGYVWVVDDESSCSPVWNQALRFRRSNQTATLLFDLDCQQAYLLERQREVRLAPILADALTKFLENSETQ